jgi:hypothetical protein
MIANQTIVKPATQAQIFDSMMAISISIAYTPPLKKWQAMVRLAYYLTDTDDNKVFATDELGNLITRDVPVADVLAKGAVVPELLAAFSAMETAIQALVTYEAANDQPNTDGQPR